MKFDTVIYEHTLQEDDLYHTYTILIDGQVWYYQNVYNDWFGEIKTRMWNEDATIRIDSIYDISLDKVNPAKSVNLLLKMAILQ